MIAGTVGCKWPVRKLIDLVDPGRPITYGILMPGDDIKEGIPYVRVVDLQDGRINIDGLRRTTKEIAAKYRRSTLRAGDVLMSIRGHVGRCALVPDTLVGANITQDTARFAVTNECEAQYLIWCLRSTQSQRWMMRHVKGVAVKGINLGDVKEIPIPLPPVKEQQRIAAILDQAEALRAKRRAALAKLDMLTQAIFVEMFGDPVFNVQKWPRIQLEAMCGSSDDIKCGPFGTQLAKSEFRSEGVPLWGIKNVNALFELPTHEFLEPRTAKRLAQYSIEPGDIVMTRKGTIGNCAIYPETFPFGIMHSDLLRLRACRKKCDPSFLAHQLHYSRHVETQLALISGGAVMPGINVTKLKNLEVIAPPVSLQREFARRTAAVEKLKAAHRLSLSKLDALFASLQHNAFRGEM